MTLSVNIWLGHMSEAQEGLHYFLSQCRKENTTLTPLFLGFL